MKTLEEMQKRRYEKWLCYKCVKILLCKNGEVRCRVFIAGYELGKTGKCWAYSDDPEFFSRLTITVRKYQYKKTGEC